MTKRCPPLRLTRAELTFDRTLARLILGYAWAAALQQAVVMIGRFLVQGMLTPLGAESVTGYNMGMRVEQFIFCFSQGVSAAMVVGIAMNLGHGDHDRVRALYRTAVRVELACFAVMGTLLWFYAPQAIGIFSDNPAVVAAGARYSATMAFIYIFAFLGEVIQSFFRAIGRLRLTMLASFLQVLLRVVLSYLLIPIWGVYGICTAIATGWVLLVLIEGAYSLRTARKLA